MWGLLELYQASFDARYLGEAIAVADAMLAAMREEDGEAAWRTITGDVKDSAGAARPGIWVHLLDSGGGVAVQVDR